MPSVQPAVNGCLKMMEQSVAVSLKASAIAQGNDGRRFVEHFRTILKLPKRRKFALVFFFYLALRYCYDLSAALWFLFLQQIIRLRQTCLR